VDTLILVAVAATSILIVSLERARTSPIFATVIGMRLISFLIFGLVARRHMFS
jgi:hypothetical protein